MRGASIRISCKGRGWHSLHKQADNTRGEECVYVLRSAYLQKREPQGHKVRLGRNDFFPLVSGAHGKPKPVSNALTSLEGLHKNSFA